MGMGIEIPSPRQPWILDWFRAVLYRELLGTSKSTMFVLYRKKGKGSRYSINELKVPELIPVLGSQPAGDLIHRTR